MISAWVYNTQGIANTWPDDKVLMLVLGLASM